MDLGIAGRWALVSGSSQGLGRACAQALSAEGVNVVLNGRDAQKLEAVADELRERTSAEVVPCAADLTTDEGRASFLAACPEPDILVTNNRGPRPGSLFDVSDDDIAAALEAHFWAPLKLVRAVVPGMRERRFGRIVSITSAMITTPRSMMLASTSARTGLWAALKAVANDTVQDNVTINNLLPERIDSPRQVQMATIEAERSGITYDEARRGQAASIAAKRLGTLVEFGSACAFLCSVHAGYISGSNLHLDGGSYPGLI